MNNNNKTAGKTAHKSIWTIISLIGLMAAGTISGSLIITGIAVAMFGIGAWKAGWMQTEEGGLS